MLSHSRDFLLLLHFKLHFFKFIMWCLLMSSELFFERLYFVLVLFLLLIEILYLRFIVNFQLWVLIFQPWCCLCEHCRCLRHHAWGQCVLCLLHKYGLGLLQIVKIQLSLGLWRFDAVLNLIQIVCLRRKLSLEVALKVTHSRVLLGSSLKVVSNVDLTLILIVSTSHLTLHCPLLPGIRVVIIEPIMVLCHLVLRG